MLEEENISGTFYEIIKLFSSNLNFTYTLFRRNDRTWGVLANGTWNGMVSNLINGDMDIIGASLTYSLERFPVIDFIVPMAQNTEALFIQYSDLEVEVSSWLLYFQPLTWWAWGGILLITLSMSSAYRGMKFVSEKNSRKSLRKNCFSFVKNIIASFSAFFGGTAFAENKTHAKRDSMRLVTFLVLFCGNVSWQAYQASLSSFFKFQLSNPPFTDYATFYDTSYR